MTSDLRSRLAESQRNADTLWRENEVLKGHLAAAERERDEWRANAKEWLVDNTDLRQRLAATEGLLKEGHDGGYFDAPAGFYERVEAHLAGAGSAT